MREPTTEELQAALARIRALPRCADWPADVVKVQADPVRKKLLRLLALHPGPVLEPPIRNEKPRVYRPWMSKPMSSTPQIDLKRAASGERDE